MPDIKKVIKGLETCYCPPSKCEDCPYYDLEDEQKCNDCNDTLCLDALALLKEQEEPKQIIRKQCKNEWGDGIIDYFTEFYCPHCNMLIQRGFENSSIKFCYKCGKPILWKGQ